MIHSGDVNDDDRRWSRAQHRAAAGALGREAWQQIRVFTQRPPKDDGMALAYQIALCWVVVSAAHHGNLALGEVRSL